MATPGNNKTKTLVFLFAFVMAMSAFAVLTPVTEAADNEAPDWSEGDGVAVSMSVDFMDLYNAQQDNFSAAIEELLMDLDEEAVELDDLSITQASARAVVMLEVTEVTSTSYSIVQMAAFEVKLGGSVTWKSMLPDAGSYDDDVQAWANVSNKTVSASLNLVLGVSEQLTLVLDKQSMALQSITLRLQPAIDLRISGTGIPDMGYEDGDDNTTTYDVSYGTLDARLVMNPALTLSAGFDPYFNLFNLPNPDADNWSTETENVTISAALSGFIDVGVSGTSNQAVEANTTLDQFFDDVPAGVTGLNGFPVDLSQVTIPASVFDENNTIGITNGAIPDQVIPVPQINMTSTGNTTSDLSGILDEFTVYGIWFEDGAGFGDPPGWADVFYPAPTGLGTTLVTTPYGIPYSAALLDLDDWSVILDNVTADLEEDMVTVMSDMTGMDMSGSMTFSSISTASANEIEESISQTIASINPVGEEGGFDIVSFFLDSPYYGIIALVGILVIVAVITRR